MIRTLLAALLTLNPLLIDLVHAQQCNGQPPQNTTVTGTAMRTFPSGELKVYLEGGGWDFTAIAGFQQAAANWNAALQGNGFSHTSRFQEDLPRPKKPTAWSLCVGHQTALSPTEIHATG